EVLPGGIRRHIEEDAAIAGIFDVEIDFPIEKGAAHDGSCAELEAVDGRNCGGAQDQADHLADHRRLARELRGDDDGGGGGGERRRASHECECRCDAERFEESRHVWSPPRMGTRCPLMRCESSAMIERCKTPRALSSSWEGWSAPVCSTTSPGSAGGMFCSSRRASSRPARRGTPPGACIRSMARRTSRSCRNT